MKEVMRHYCRLGDFPGLTLKASITSIICAGWKVLGEDQVNCINAWDFKTRWRKNINDDYMVCKSISKILMGADAVVTHNGRRFDWKHLQTRLLFHKLPLLPKIIHLDTCQAARSNLMMFSNKLGNLGEFLVGDKKLENGGWELWVNVMDKQAAAMKLMTDYCKQDVALLEKVFLRLRPIISGIPHHGIFSAEANACPVCASFRVSNNGTRVNKEAIYTRYRCLDCGSSFRSNFKKNKTPQFKHL